MELNNRKTRKVQLDFDGEILNVELSASIKYGKLKELTADEDAPEKVIGFIIEYVKGWDLTLDGEPVPITHDGLDLVDSDILAEIVTKITENPTKPQAKP